MPDQKINDSALRRQLIELLSGGQAHAKLEDIVAGFPVNRAGERPQGLPHSAWELLEHIRIAQDDILRFSRSSDYKPMKWPDDYWPKLPAPEHEEQWKESVQSIQSDLAAFQELIRDPAKNLNEPFPWGDGQTLLREALLIADHNAYHLGQLVLVRRALGTWKG